MSGPGSRGVLSQLSRTGTQPAVVYSRSKNLAELYQAPLVAGRVPELFGPPAAVGPGHVGAVSRRPHVGGTGLERMIDLDGAALGQGNPAPGQERGVGDDPDGGEHEVAGQLLARRPEAAQPTVPPAPDLL